MPAAQTTAIDPSVALGMATPIRKGPLLQVDQLCNCVLLPKGRWYMSLFLVLIGKLMGYGITKTCFFFLPSKSRDMTPALV